MPGSANANGSGGERARMVQGCEHRLYRDGQGPRIEETLPVLRAPHAGMRCPVEAALQVLDDRWKTLIVWRLFWGARPFCELMRGTSGISKKTLRRQLSELERHGLVHRRLRPGGRRRAEYSLTPFGDTLKPIVGQIYQWGLMLLEGGAHGTAIDGAGTS
jgi:DNA-binding HxlR family transcriptional regulator